MSNLQRRPQQEPEVSIYDPECVIYSPQLIEAWAESVEFKPNHNDKYADYFLALIAQYVCEEDGTFAGPPELWLRNIISYSFFFGLAVTLHDREFARYILYGLSEGWSRRALYWLEQVKRTDHDKNTHLWGHAINFLTILTREMSPRESAPDVDPKLLNEVGRLVGFIPALRVGLNDPEFAEVLFDGAVEERERCDEEKLNDRIWLMNRIISDFWSKDKARSTY